MFEKRYRLLWECARGLRRAQAKTLVAMAAALIGCGRMRSFALAAQLAGSSRVRFKSALQRFYRFVHNPRLDELACWSALAERLLSQAGARPLVAVDWTEWHSGLRVLAAAVCAGSRAVPVLVQAFSKSDIPRSQNTREHIFIHLLVRLSERMERAVLIFDRGFRRVSLIRELGSLRQEFIVRLAVKVHVVAEGYQGLLSHHGLKPGEVVDLGRCMLNARTPVRTRVVGLWAEGQAEPWWLATSLGDPAILVAQYYDRRMGVEEAFRDAKGSRFGIKIEWTAFATGAALARVFLLAAIAIAVWTLAGRLACRNDPTLALPSRTKGPRRSLIAIGIEAQNEVRRVLATRWITAAHYWPPPHIRHFAWQK